MHHCPDNTLTQPLITPKPTNQIRKTNFGTVAILRSGTCAVHYVMHYLSQCKYKGKKHRKQGEGKINVRLLTISLTPTPPILSCLLTQAYLGLTSDF